MTTPRVVKIAEQGPPGAPKTTLTRLGATLPHRDAVQELAFAYDDPINGRTVRDPGVIDVRAAGMVADSDTTLGTDNYAAFQALLDAVAGTGATLYVPAPKNGKRYGLAHGPLRPGHNTRIIGDGPASWIHNYFGGPSTLAFEGSIFNPSGYDPGATSWYDETAYNINDVAPGSFTIQLQTHGDASHMPAGTIVWACGAQFNTATGQNLPLDSAINEVITSDTGSGLVTLKYPIRDALLQYLGTPAFVRPSTNTIANPFLGRTCQAIKRVEIAHLKLSQIPGNTWGLFTSGGAWEWRVHDLHLDGEVGVSWNWIGHCEFYNLNARLTRKMWDIAATSIGVRCHDNRVQYYSGPTGAGLSQVLIHLAHGERGRDCVWERESVTASMPMAAVSITAKRATVRDCTYSMPAAQDNANGLITLTQDDPTVHAEDCRIEDNTIIQPVLNQPSLTIQAKPAREHRNVVRGNKFIAPINKAVPVIDVRNNGNHVLVEDNHLPNGWIRSVNGLVTPGAFLRRNETRLAVNVPEDHFAGFTGFTSATEFEIYTLTIPKLTELAQGDNVGQSVLWEVWGTYSGNATTGKLRLYDQSNVLQAFFPGIVGTGGGAQSFYLRVQLALRIGNSQFWSAELFYNGNTYASTAIGQAIDMTTSDYSLDLRGILVDLGGGSTGGDSLAVREIRVSAGQADYQVFGNQHSSGSIDHDSSAFAMAVDP